MINPVLSFSVKTTIVYHNFFVVFIIHADSVCWGVNLQITSIVSVAGPRRVVWLGIVIANLTRNSQDVPNVVKGFYCADHNQISKICVDGLNCSTEF